MKVTAVAQRSGNWWAIHVPKVAGALIQARRSDPAMAADAVALVLDVDESSIEVTMIAVRDPG